jgi:integrase
MMRAVTTKTDHNWTQAVSREHREHVFVNQNVLEFPRVRVERPRAPARLTALSIEALKPRRSRYEITDPACKGLQVRVECNGSKFWMIRYSWRKERVRLTLGAWPGMTLAQARELVILAQQMIDRGIDPRRGGLTQKLAHVANAIPTTEGDDKHTVAFLASEFLRLHIRVRRKDPRYVQRTLDKDVLPFWGGRDVRTIKPREVIELLDRVVSRGALVTANHLASVLSQMFRFGIHRALVETSPVQLLYRPGGKETPRQRVLSEAELRSFVTNLEDACRFDLMPHVMMILLLTGQRRGELALAKWAEVDFSAKTWQIPDENSKSGRGHVVPLSDWAVEEFQALQRMAGRSRFVLPAQSVDGPMDPKLLTRSVARCLKRFKKYGIAQFTLHDLRRTCRTGLARLKVPNDIAERVLNHARNGIEGVYDLHTYVDEKRTALDAWAAYLRAQRPTVVATFPEVRDKLEHR